jgi:exodeoxyribonuclease V alpha subunit
MSKSIAPHLIRLLAQLNGAPVPELDARVASLCESLEQGHVCLPSEPDELVVRKLRACSVVGAPGDFRPLILDSAGRLYLQRYWDHENRLALQLLSRASARPAHDSALLASGVARFLGDAAPEQRAAVENAVTRGFSVITGGPGTGKTYTATVALVLLATQFAASGNGGRIAIAAPTGKAAARIGESLAATLAKFDLSPEVRALLPAEASTVHRLLGSRPGSPDFKHDARNPLNADVVVVDESTMVDLPLMARLFDALRPDARVVLLGDKDQLASVEAGHVLGDICTGLHDGTVGPLRSNITELTRNYRFGDDSSIHRLSRAIRAGTEAGVQRLLATDRDDLASLEVSGSLFAQLAPRVVAGFRGYLDAPTPAEALARFTDYRILTATRNGEASAEQLNRFTERALSDARLTQTNERYYAGRPILIRRNDYNLRLFNGDIGIVLPDAESGGELRAFFPGENGDVRALAPTRLPEHETAFAMTVHKSQGSEFRRVLVVLPPRDVPVLSRELLYTAVTRAREHVELWWSAAALAPCLSRGVQRFSGLRERLWSAV